MPRCRHRNQLSGLHPERAACIAPVALARLPKTALRPVALAVQLATAGALLAAAAWVPDAQAQTAAEQARRFDISAGTLTSALNRFAQKAGVFLSAPAELTQGKISPGLNGSYSVSAGFAALLAGSGLRAEKSGGGTYTLHTVPEVSAVSLESIIVKGRIDNSDLAGQTYGYTALTGDAGSKLKKDLVKTAQSISVITRQQIEDQRPASVSQALNYSAGAFTGLVGAANRYDYIGMRGFNENMTDNTLVDGQKLLSDSNTFAQMQIDPYFIERIDMVKGPVSSIYGRATPGGVVATTTKRPLHETYREINVFGGNFKQRGVSFDLTDNIDQQGALSYRLTALLKASDSQNEGQQNERHTIAPSLSWNISPSTNLLLQAYLQNDPDGGYHSGLPADGMVTSHHGFRFSRSFSDSDPGDYFSRRQNIYGYQLTHLFNEKWKFTSRLRYAEVNVENRQVWQTGWRDMNSLGRASGNNDEHLRSTAFDNYVTGNFNTGMLAHRVLIGSDYQHRKTSVIAGYNYSEVPALDVHSPVHSPRTYGWPDYPIDKSLRLRQIGFYAQDQMQINKWYLTAALRHDKVDTSVMDRMTGSKSSQWNGSKSTWQASLLYAFDNGLSPYLGYGEGFNPNTYQDVNGRLLRPTRSRQWEAGLKYQPSASSDLYTLAVYDLQQENVANRVVNGNYYIPSGTVHSKGIELEVKKKISDSWFLQAALAWNRIEFANTTNGLNGKTPFQAPKLTASLWSNYQFENGLDVSAGLRYISGIWADNENTLKVPPYAVVALAARYDLGRIDGKLKAWEASLSINNLLDRKYVASCAGLNYCYYGEERNILANLSYHW